jgi:hypothetical protein
VNAKFAELSRAVETQVLRLHLAPNHSSDGDLSPGTPIARQIPLRMTAFVK